MTQTTDRREEVRRNLLAERAITNLAEAYRQMPNGGALLTIDEGGLVGNGLRVVAHFTTERSAAFWLRSSGFVRDRRGRWKLADFIEWV